MWQSGAAAVKGKQRASKPPPRQMEEKIFEGITIFDKKKINFLYPGVFLPNSITTMCFNVIFQKCINVACTWQFDRTHGWFTLSKCNYCGCGPGQKGFITLGRKNTYVQVDEETNAGGKYVGMKEKHFYGDKSKTGTYSIGATSDENNNITYCVVSTKSIKEVET